MRESTRRLLLRPTTWPDRALRFLGTWLPKGLYARALLIILAPIIILQSFLAWLFMERHYESVTRRLSQAVTQDIAAIIEVIESYPQETDFGTIERIARLRLNLDVDVLPQGDLPAPAPKPFFLAPDRALSDEIRRQIGRPFWIDTVGKSSFVEVRVKLDKNILRVIARRSQTYASNAHIFLMWMGASSLFLMGIAILFLRNQIKPILRLAAAAESFGKGRDTDFRPRGAREVRQAGHAFMEMKRRIERQIEQRTAMLNGVSHDLRTILTRFKLSLALNEDTAEVEALRKDVDEMARMLEAYLAFARGDASEQAQATDIRAMLEDLKGDMERQGHATAIVITGDPTIEVRPDSFKRLLANLVGNAARFGDKIAINAAHEGRWLTVTIDDDGPGIPADKREDVFKPFFRLDEARNQDESGTGLGLAIARDIARSHGGDIQLSDSPMGGLRCTVRVPA